MSILKSRDNVGIFISYRRADTAGQAGRLADKLKGRFGDLLFFDIDSIEPGANFRDKIASTFAKCGAVVVMIGKKWLDREPSMPPFGDPRDVITQELTFAMEARLPILPVLVDGASMPSESMLPSAFTELSKLNAVDLRHTSFERDLQAIGEQLAEILGGAKATAIEKFLLKIYGPFVGNSIGHISGGMVLIAAGGAGWGLIELAASGWVTAQSGFRDLFSTSVFDPEMSRLQAIWTAALASVVFGFMGRRSIRWWRHATITIWVSGAEIVLAALLAFLYISHFPETRVMDLFDSKKIAVSP